MRPTQVTAVAEALHNGWWAYMRRAGYRYGPRDRGGKTHAHMLPWSECPPENNEQDRYIARAAIEFLEERERAQPAAPVSDEEVAREIHNAWAAYVRAQGRTDHPTPLPRTRRQERVPLGATTKARRLGPTQMPCRLQSRPGARWGRPEP